MTYRISNREVELLLSFYRDIQKYNELLEKERKDAHYGVDSQIYAAFKLNRVSESTKFSYIHDYCSMIQKAMKSWENSKSDKEYKKYRTIQLMFLGKRHLSQLTVAKLIDSQQNNLRLFYINKGVEIFKSYLIKQLTKLNYTQSDNTSIIVNEDYQFEYSRNLELLYYITCNVAKKSREYFKTDNSFIKSKAKIHTMKTEAKRLKEVS